MGDIAKVFLVASVAGVAGVVVGSKAADYINTTSFAATWNIDTREAVKTGLQAGLVAVGFTVIQSLL